MSHHPWSLRAPEPPALVVPVRVDPAGLAGPTRAQSRSLAWRAVSPGRFVPAKVTDEVVEQRIVEAYARSGQRAVVTGWASLRLHGAGFFDGLARDGRTRLPVPIAANGDRLRSRDGVEVVRNRVPDDEVVVIHGIRCTTVERALLDEVRRLDDRWDQVIAVDMTCAARLTSIRRMRRYRWARYWYRDIRRLDDVLPVCNEDARSRPEVDFRRIWTQDAGWADPVCNRTVLDLDGVAVGLPDLLDVRRCVAGEFAGGGHRDPDQHTGDLTRVAAFRRVGIETVEVTGTHLRNRQLIVSWLGEAEERAALLPQRWQLALPGPSLDELLDQDAAGRVE